MYLPFSTVFVNQHIFMLIFEANFSTQYLILFCGSRAGLDIYKWVPTQGSLGTTGLKKFTLALYSVEVFIWWVSESSSVTHPLTVIED